MSELSEETILTTFDKLVEDGVIIYGPHDVVCEEFGGYPLEFRICPSLEKKPNTVGSAIDPALASARPWGPGSDMFCPDERLKLAQLNNTHELALNLFCVDRPQLLLLTLDSYKRQHEPMDLDDFKASIGMMRACRSMYAIYNCGQPAGCSRVHKHMQGLRGPPTALEAIVRPTDKATVPFQYFAHQFENRLVDTTPSEVLNAYLSMLVRSREALGLKADATCPHNVVLWDSWLIVVPRRKSSVGKASANSAGMLGSVWFADKSFLDEWHELGPRHVLQELGVRNMDQ